MCPLRVFIAGNLVLASVYASADAQTPSVAQPSTGTPAASTSPSQQSDSTTLPTIRVTAPRAKLPAARPKPSEATVTPPAAPPPSSYQTGAPNVAGGPQVAPTMASQMTVSGQDLNNRPVTRPGEILEAAPGLAVVDHADGGKANQYYLRGYNLDHGTDLGDLRRRHADQPADPCARPGLRRSQLADAGDRQQPRYPQRPILRRRRRLRQRRHAVVNLRDSVDQKIVEATSGSFGYERLFTMGSTKLDGGSLLYAGEVNTYNGPWATPDDMHKLSGLLRYSQGTATDGLSATAMAYSNTWTSTDQIPLRAIQSGLVGLYGELDPTDGGDTSRSSLSARMAQTDDDGSWKANAYLVKYELDLFNNYTWYLTDPVERRPISSARRPRLRRRRRLAHVRRVAVRSADGNGIRLSVALRRHQSRVEQYGAAAISLGHTRRSRQRGQRRHLCREYGALDQLAQHHARLARRLLRGVGELDPAARRIREIRKRRSAARNSAW